MLIKLLALGASLCGVYHADCSHLNTNEGILKFNLAMFEHEHITIGVPALGDFAWRQADPSCKERFGGKSEAAPVYLYQMYDGEWGTEFICRRRTDLIS